MPSNPWNLNDNKPDLSHLPAHLRELQTKPMPFRPNEVQGRIILKKAVALVHPNGRIYAAPYRVTTEAGVAGAQVVFSEFSGREDLGAFILTPDAIPKMLYALAGIHKASGGDTLSLLKTMIEKVEESHE